MNLPLKIANRLSLKKSGAGQNQSPGVTVAIAGIAVAIVVMILTFAIVSGFQNQIREKVIGFDSQISVSRYLQTPSETEFFVYNDTVGGILKSVLPQSAVVTPQLSSMSLLKTNDDYIGLQLVANEKVFNDYISQYLVCESDSGLMTGKSLVVSKLTASRLDLNVGDKVYAHFFVKGSVKTRRLVVSGIYDTSFGERDKRIAFCSAGLLRSVFDLDSAQVQKLEITGCDFNKIGDISDKIQHTFVTEFYEGKVKEVFQVDNVLTSGAAYFGWLELLDTNVVVIIILMSLVAAFTLVSSLFILVLERVKMIGVLKSLGATDGMISKVFVYLAMKIVGLGLIAGNVTGLLLVWLQWQFRILPLNPEAYYLSYVPVEFNIWHWLLLNTGAIIISWLVLILPSMIVSRISPASTIRYE